MTKSGPFNAHHYRYSRTQSTFLVETTAANFERQGMARLSEEDSRALCQNLFANELEGAQLISNRSVWRQFPKVTNQRWHHGNIVLVGDALRTAHYSIGSGTRLALEDVQALVKAIAAADGDISEGLYLYEARRRPIVEKLVAAAARSADWYETFDRTMTLPPLEFAHEYMSRSGRIDPVRLASISPKFLARYAKWKDGQPQRQ
jgi:2-polyprenyl-6-methoxyphenol hydroxylase-like FAD-dependent oxidoreductase